ncbi:uncharacterized protein LOC116186482 [Apis dorsata]|uniref:uncharacterized protein LOC116186482 n=1 Tax=Apis dorsata TaxID=7462 RepID=UPI001293C8F1|nr:uncharacterized protein LOC116186482 [Apis dorsata]
MFSCFIFFIYYVSQRVLDETFKFFDIPYNGNWYDLPLPIQKLLLFIIQGRKKPVLLSICGIFVPTYKMLLMQCKMTWSCFIMLYSIQK